MEAIENVFVFVSDGLRWDHLPDAVDEMGVTLKTVAQALYSPPSFSTLSTGLYPRQHGVTHWRDGLPNDVDTIYDVPGIDATYYDEKRADPLYETFGITERRGLDAMEPPFLHLERDLTPHVPYDTGLSGGDRAASDDLKRDIAGSAEDYVADRAGETDRIRREYAAGVEDSVALFRRRLEVLEDAALTDDTLVVFTSDHGELLGESGLVGHTSPMRPELAYVPTVLIHPEIDGDAVAVDTDRDVIEHVDLVTTLLTVLGVDGAVRTMGTDLTTSERPRDWGYSHVDVERRGRSLYRADGAWFRDGGHVYTRNAATARMAYYAYNALGSYKRHVVRRHPLAAFHAYVRGGSVGEPPESRSATREALDRLVSGLDQAGSTDIDLDEDAERHLRDLGYLE